MILKAIIYSFATHKMIYCVLLRQLHWFDQNLEIGRIEKIEKHLLLSIKEDKDIVFPMI